MNQYYRVHAVIDLDAICHNIQEVKRVVGEGVKVMPVIKADGYGHGAVPIAKELNKIGVDAFAVAILEEGITLRNHGIKKPILILGYTSEYQYSSLIQYEIEPTVFCYEMAESLSKIAQALGKVAKIHIKLDTGMNRIGFKPTQESVEIVERISKLPNIKIEGIFTHFSKADEIDKAFTKKQEAAYEQMITWLKERQVSIPVHHVSNSAGIVDLPEYNKDIVRAGIILYGLWPSDEVNKENIDLQPLLSLKSHVVHVKELEPGRIISYGGTFEVEHPMPIATVPEGYAE